MEWHTLTQNLGIFTLEQCKSYQTVQDNVIVYGIVVLLSQHGGCYKSLAYCPGACNCIIDGGTFLNIIIS